MARMGLSKETVIDAAIELIEQQGSHAFTLSELARHLSVKPASLYNYIESIEELTDSVGARIAGMLRQAETDAIEGKSEDDALYALCDAYRAFASEHPELHRVNIARQLVGSDFEKAARGEIVDPILRVLSDFHLPENEKMTWHRILRAMMHGYMTQELAAKAKNRPIDHEKTYRMAIETIALGIRRAEQEAKE